MNKKDPYSILGISQEANKSEIIKAFRNLAHKYHPDKTDDPNSNEIFRNILQAYELLKKHDFKYTNKNISSLNISLEEIRRKMKEYKEEGLFDSDFSDLIKGKTLWNMVRKKR